MISVLNIIFISLFYIFWSKTQKIINNAKLYDGFCFKDVVHELKIFKSSNEYLNANLQLTETLTILTSLMIDVNAVYFFYRFLFYNETKVIILLFIGVLLRQLCQYCVRFPKPNNIIWMSPRIPSLIVDYSVSSDFFFSGHTLCALIFGCELFLYDNILIKLYSTFYIFAEIFFVLATRAHYFADTYTAFTTYFMLLYFLQLFMY